MPWLGRTAHATERSVTTELASGVAEILDGAVASGIVPGAAFAVSRRDGDMSLVTAGTLRVGDDDPATTATMFRLMSMTKPLGSVARCN
jgi:CubicO group peptidase (beta-lactamase class C family)